MSGGAFDYSQRSIKRIVEVIEERLRIQGKKIPTSPLFADMFSDEELYYEEYPKAVVKRMEEGIYILRLAYIYANNIDLYLCGDNGDDSFLESLRFDLDKLESGTK